jgi:uncharacterized membrane protein YfcA
VYQLLASTVFGSLPRYLLACLILLGAEAVYVLFGFGVGLIAVGTLAMVLPQVQDVVVLLVLVNLPPEALVVTKSRRSINWRGVLLVCVGIAVGVPLGTIVLQQSNPLFILVLLGGFLLLAGLVFLLLPERYRVRWPRWAGAVAGGLGGLLAGMFGTGGPPLILYYRLAGLDKTTFRGNLMAVFLVVSLVRLASYAVAGLITTERLWSAALALPAVLLGTLLGNAIHLRIRELTFQRLVAAALMAIGALLLVRLC